MMQLQSCVQELTVMQMRKIEVLSSALNDLADIVGYISHELYNPSAAHKLVDDFYKKVTKLKDNPELYTVHESETVKTVFRKMTLGGYLVFYTVTDEYVYIAFVLHSLQDVDRILETY